MINSYHSMSIYHCIDQTVFDSISKYAALNAQRYCIYTFMIVGVVY